MWIDEDTPSKKAIERYDRLIAQWLNNNRRPLPPRRRDDEVDGDELTIAELALTYFEWADGNYRKNGKRTAEPRLLRASINPVVERFGVLGVNEFGPNALREVRDSFIGGTWSRNTINNFTHKIRKMFRWAVSRELCKPEVIIALATVETLQKGRAGVREGHPTKVPSVADFEKVVAKSREPVRSALWVQRFTGMRAGELLQMRACDIDRRGPVWWYVPRSHKTEHLDIERRIPIGPKAQEFLTPLIQRTTPTGPLFVMRTHQAKGKPLSIDIYAYQLHAACKRAKVERFRPHSLRHLRLRELRDQLSIDHAQAVAGHTTASMTEHYAKLTAAKAEEAAKASG